MSGRGERGRKPPRALAVTSGEWLHVRRDIPAWSPAGRTLGRAFCRLPAHGTAFDPAKDRWTPPIPAGYHADNQTRGVGRDDALSRSEESRRTSARSGTVEMGGANQCAGVPRASRLFDLDTGREVAAPVVEVEWRRRSSAIAWPCCAAATTRTNPATWPRASPSSDRRTRDDEECPGSAGGDEGWRKGITRSAPAPPGRDERRGGMGGHVGAPHVTRRTPGRPAGRPRPACRAWPTRCRDRPPTVQPTFRSRSPSPR